MPKSKKKKRKSKDTSKRASSAPSPKPLQEELPETLAHDSGVVFQLTLASPLIFGAWLAGGFLLENFVTFTILFAAWAAAYHMGRSIARPGVGSAHQAKQYLLLLAQLGAVAYFYFASEQDALVTSLFALAAVVTVINSAIVFTKVSSVTSVCMGIPLQMMLFAVLGVHSQHLDLHFHSAIIGLCPALCLAAAVVARYSILLEKEAWIRSVERTKKDGTPVTRPGGLSRLFSLFCFAAPGLPLVLVPFGLLPESFLLVGLLIIPVPKIAEAFLKQNKADIEIAGQLIFLGALNSVLCLLSGVIAKYLLY